MMETRYHFFSFGRQGLTATIDRDPGNGQKRAEIDLAVDVGLRAKGTTTLSTAPDSPSVKVQLYGPGDVVGFDERIVVRTDPVADTGNFEQNYFPAVEFADFDFPWRYSPKKDDEKGFTPWIVLIALKAEDRGENIRREYEEIKRARGQTPVVKVFNSANLPNLSCAWRWAHVQVTSDKTTIDDDLNTILKNYRSSVRSRLLCPRRLQPGTLYTAFVVPVYKLGIIAGLDTPAAWDEAKNCGFGELGWRSGPEEPQGKPIDLPYYYRWDFRTSVRGDFEYLVRMLEKKPVEGLGLREIDCGQSGYGLSVDRTDCVEPDKKHTLGMEGALRSVDTRYTAWGRDREIGSTGQSPIAPEEFQQRLAGEVLNKPDADRVLLDMPDSFNSAEVLSQLFFDLLPDGKSVRVCWETLEMTTGRIEYGSEFSHIPPFVKPIRRSVRRKNTPISIEVQEAVDLYPVYPNYGISDSLSKVHAVVITLVPEKTYHFRFKVSKPKTGQEMETGSATIRIPLPVVVPPIYGKWHAARRTVDPNGEGWINELNLDPRHRAAAGLGAEVVRKQQEALIASAWEQLGEIETANDILRRAQTGRECSNFLHERFKSMALEDFLRCSAPIQKRTIREINRAKTTIAVELSTETRIPAAALDPTFRRIARARGPLRKRQEKFGGVPRRMDMLRRIAIGEIAPAGPHPRPEGMVSPGKITEELWADYQNENDISVPRSLYLFVEPDGSGTIARSPNKNTFDDGETVSLEAEASEGFHFVRWTGDATGTESHLYNIVMNKDRTITAEFASDQPAFYSLNKYVEPANCGGSITLDPDQESYAANEQVTLKAGPANGQYKFWYWSGDPGIIVNPDDKKTCTVTMDKDKNITAHYYDIDENIGGTGGETNPASAPVSDNSTVSHRMMPSGKATIPSALRFSDDSITDTQFFYGWAMMDKDEQDKFVPKDLKTAISNAFNNLLAPGVIIENQIRSNRYFEALRQDTISAIDPRKTIFERVASRIRLQVNLSMRSAQNPHRDPLDEIMACPEFPQPMYEPLSELSESYILPGVEKVPQNSISLLETNPRFLEAYMVGLNHEFAAELLWRRYPTDQRGSCFRQFWDVEEYLAAEVEQTEGDIIGSARESMKDIPPIHRWSGMVRLGENAITNKTRLVLLIRGDLLKRYPGAVIYAVNARLEQVDGKWSGGFVPDLDEYAASILVPEQKIVLPRAHRKNNDMFAAPPPDPGDGDPIFPIFRGSLGADLVFLGFPFSPEEARSSKLSTGKFLIFEERIGEARFGLDDVDTSVEETHFSIDSWNNLNWGHFNLAGTTGTGKYLDSSTNVIDSQKETWDKDTSSALRARITLQMPARLAVHADQLLPSSVTKSK